MGIAIRVASPKLVMEEVRGRSQGGFLCTLSCFLFASDFFFFLFCFVKAPESYKNVTDVVNTCHEAGISKKAIKLRPIAVIKG